VSTAVFTTALVADKHYPSNGLGGFQVNQDSGAFVGTLGARTTVNWFYCDTTSVTIQFYHGSGDLAFEYVTSAAGDTFAQPFELVGTWYVEFSSTAHTTTVDFEVQVG